MPTPKKEKTPKKTDTQLVSDHIGALPPNEREVVQRIREIVLSVSDEIAEQIKWNSPAFYYTGDMKPFDPKEYKRDMLVCNLHRGKILLVFPTGARINDNSGILEGKYTDGRRIATIKDLPDLTSKEAALRTVISEWLATVEK